MSKIKFGTDGWRAIIAEEYTVKNVLRVTEATGKWILGRGGNSVVIGYDCRFGGELFSEYATRKFASMGIKVLRSTSFVSTPMISLGAVTHKTNAGVVITASHNPPTYNGYKIKDNYGGPALPEDIAKIESLIPESATGELEPLDFYISQGLVTTVDLEQDYIDHVKAHFDLDMIEKSGLKIAYDAMYGAGQSVLKKLLPNSQMLHATFNPSFEGVAPEPLAKNLQELATTVANDDSIVMGLATDGDADRIGLMDEKGNFVDAHHIILLLIHYLAAHKSLKGKVVTAFSVTDRVKKLCEMHNLEQITTKVGFKYICEYMVNEDVLVGGEESGGIAVKGHIPERDGIWDGLLILEYMAKSGKKLTELVAEIYGLVGSFAYHRNDLRVSEELKKSILSNCASGKYTTFGKFKVLRTEDIDGFKYHLDDEAWMMIRPSGTEPLLRVYAEASNITLVHEILENVEKELVK